MKQVYLGKAAVTILTALQTSTIDEFVEQYTACFGSRRYGTKHVLTPTRKGVTK